MSIRRTIAAAGAAAILCGAAVAAAVFYFPMRLSAQVDAEGAIRWTVSGYEGEGTATVEVIAGAEGRAIDARVVNAPDALRRQALQSALGRRCAKSALSRRTVQVTIDFTLMPAPPPPPQPPPVHEAVLEGIDYWGLSTELHERVSAVMSRLRTGDRVTAGQLAQIRGELTAIDPQLRLGTSMMRERAGAGTKLRLPVTAQPAGPPQTVRVGGGVMDSKLVHRVNPVYPPLAMQARIQGTVRFEVLIGKDGSVENMTLVAGHPLLVQAAQDAVQQYRYQPTLLNGAPVAVRSMVDVDFRL